MMHSANIGHTAQANLRALGVSWTLIELPLPYLWLLPQTSDPDTAGVVEIVRALQRGLGKIGFGSVRVSGTVDAATSAALARVSGNWRSKAWIQIIGDVVSALQNPDRSQRAIAAVMGGLGDYIEFEPSPGAMLGAGPLPGRLVGTPPGALGAVEMTIGPATTSTTLTWTPSGSSCIPVPKTNGSTYTAFKDLQRQINRLLSKYGGGRITEDGVIGSGTVAGLQKVGASLSQSFPSNCVGVANQVNPIRSMLKGFADTLGISATASPAPAGGGKAPLVGAVAPGGNATLDSLKKYAPFFLLAAGVAYLASRKKTASPAPAVA